MRGLRHFLVHLALAALFLRAFMPTGWMPDPQGQATFIICSQDGPVLSADGKALPGKDDPRAHESCPFAAATGTAPPVNVIALAAPLLSESAAPRDLRTGTGARGAPFLKPASRAPPAFS